MVGSFVGTWKNRPAVHVYSPRDGGQRSSGDLIVKADRLMREFVLPNSSPSDPGIQEQFIWLPMACCRGLFSAAGGQVLLAAGIFTDFGRREQRHKELVAWFMVLLADQMMSMIHGCW